MELDAVKLGGAVSYASASEIGSYVNRTTRPLSHLSSGAASYAPPLVSTGFLIPAGVAEATATLALAALLIAGGGLIAAKDMFRIKRN